VAALYPLKEDRLMSNPCPSLGTARGQNLSAVSGFHSLTKAVLFFSLQLFWLVSSFHKLNSLPFYLLLPAYGGS
jgi:uncharacterized membrane protein